MGNAQDSLFQKKYFVWNKDTMPYRILLPVNYDPQKVYPLVVFLHGSGERGNDNQAQLVHGAKLFLADSNRNRFPAIVVFPQCSANSYWSNVRINQSDSSRTFNFLIGGKPTVAMILLERLLTDIPQQYKISKKQRYIGGLSMGGMGTLELINRHPSMFAGAFSICGGANVQTAKNLKNTPIWFFHGAKDNVVPVHYSVDLAEALLKLDAKVKIKVYPNDNHNSWDNTFAEPDLLPWLFAQRRK